MNLLNKILIEIHEIERKLQTEKSAEKIRALKERLLFLQTEFKKL